MKLFRFPEDRLPTALIILLFVLDLAIYFYVDSVFFLTMWLLGVLTLKVCICSWNHHHQHLLTFRKAWLNRMLEVVYAFHTGITSNAWVLHHVLGHHVNYLDQKQDESAWMRRNGTKMGEIEYTLTIAITGYIRAFRVGRKHPKYQPTFVGMGFLVSLLLAGLFYYNWVNALFVFAIPMAFGYLATCWHTYSHHAGLDTQNQYEASHNIMHRWYNLLTGNLGYHTAHHVKPGLHWSKLPEFHATIEDKIPPHLYQDPFFPINLLPK